MKTLIKKEIRLLLPAWIIAMLLAIVPRVLILLWETALPQPYYQDSMSSFAELIFVIGLLFLGINSFGQELSSNTFSALLSQPIKRPRIWRIKVATLAIAFISVWLAAVLFAFWQCGVLDQWHPQLNEHPDLGVVFVFLTLSALVAFSGGLWTTLLLRQTTGAFWFTLLTPLAITLGITAMFEDRIAAGKSIETLIVGALVLYSIAGFGLARRLFMRAQDIQWTGGEISLPRPERISKIGAGSLAFRRGHRFSALAWKELQFHQGAFLIAAIVLVLHLAAWCLRTFHPPAQNSDLELVLEAIWILWLLMPLLIGAAAIAEERKMGTLEPQLCLPVSRGAQLFVKFCIALVLSLFFGALIPVLIEGTTTLNHWPWIFAAAAGIFFVSFYASSLGRTTLQGIGLTILVSLLIYFYLIGSWLVSARPRIAYIANPQLGIELLERYLGIPIFLIAMAWLTFGNFKHVNQNWKFSTRNIATILAVFVCVPLLARGVYFRPWELVLALEPRGPVRIADPNQVKFASTFGTICAIQPDGRLWVGAIVYSNVPNYWDSSPSLAPDHCRGHFIGGSNWVDVAVDEAETVAVQSNGTLWAIPTEWTPAETPPRTVALTQVGAGTDWSRVATEQNGFLILKKDGTLWTWGNHTADWIRQGNSALSKKINRDLASMPIRVSVETNWTELYSARFIAYAKNKDGIWQSKQMIQETNMDKQWTSLQFRGDLSYVEVKTNGDLWYFKKYAPPSAVRYHALRLGHSAQEQLGVTWKWKTAGFGQVNGIESIIAIRSDGTLWKFPTPWSYPPDYALENPAQIGTRSDWIALSDGFSLAADGSIWGWDKRTAYIWLAPSRKPVHFGNIFEGEEAEIAKSSFE